MHAKKVAKNRFDIVTPHRTWYFKQFDPYEMAEWIMVHTRFILSLLLLCFILRVKVILGVVR